MRTLILAAAISLVAGAASAASVMVMQPEVRASLGNVPTAAAFGTIHNTGGADRLVAVTCACAAKVTMHQTVATNGVARMVEEKTVAVPANGMVSFAPGGRHLMLTGVKSPIRAGTKVPMTLRFEQAGAVQVVFDAVDTPAAAADHKH